MQVPATGEDLSDPSDIKAKTSREMPTKEACAEIKTEMIIAHQKKKRAADKLEREKQRAQEAQRKAANPEL